MNIFELHLIAIDIHGESSSTCHRTSWHLNGLFSGEQRAFISGHMFLEYFMVFYGIFYGIFQFPCHHLTTGWWFGTFGLFFRSVGNVIIPTDEVIFLYIFQRGRLKPPTSISLLYISTIYVLAPQ